MPGRDVSIPGALAPKRARSKRIVAGAVAALALLGLGIWIGSRIAAPTETAPSLGAETSIADDRSSAIPARPARSSNAPTRAGAVSAAARSITAFSGDVLLNPTRLRAVVSQIASKASRPLLLAAFNEASIQMRTKLGAATVPQPVIVLRSLPIGYRVERFSKAQARVSVWYVGIVGSGATVEPQQSWRTQVVDLVWEGGAWKVDSFASSPGPTPPLSATEATAQPGDLFAAIPRFEEFRRAEP